MASPNILPQLIHPPTVSKPSSPEHIVFIEIDQSQLLNSESSVSKKGLVCFPSYRTAVAGSSIYAWLIRAEDSVRKI